MAPFYIKFRIQHEKVMRWKLDGIYCMEVEMQLNSGEESNVT
jgi:hypothetical protein